MIEMTTPISRKYVYNQIDRERDYQDKKWGTFVENPHTVGEWLLIISGELDEAISAWQKNAYPPHTALDEIRQIASCAIACLEEHHCPERGLKL